MARMRTNPVASIPDEFMEENLVRLESLVKEVGSWLRQYMVWESEYEDVMETDLKQKVDGKISKMETDFKAYQLAMAVKKKALQPSGPPPPAVSMPAASSGGQDLFLHLQQEQRREMATKRI